MGHESMIQEILDELEALNAKEPVLPWELYSKVQEGLRQGRVASIELARARSLLDLLLEWHRGKNQRLRNAALAKVSAVLSGIDVKEHVTGKRSF